MISGYLLELLDELPLPPRRRRRILAEVDDHLACAAAELRLDGLEVEEAEREAVARFGPAAELARVFIEQEAALGGKRAAQASGVLAVVLAFVVLGPAGAVVPWGSGPIAVGLGMFVLAQVALVAGCLTLVRMWSAAPAGGPRGHRLALILRGALVVVCCALGSAAFGAADLLTSAARSGWAPAGWVVLAGLGLGGVATGVTLRRSRRLAIYAADPQPGSVEPSRDQNPLGDLQAVLVLALAGLKRRVPALSGVLGQAAQLTKAFPAELMRRAPRVSSWLDLSRHPWRFAVSVATSAGLALAAGHALAEGDSLHDLRGTLLAAALIATIETLAALLGFAALGRFLGIRAPRPAA